MARSKAQGRFRARLFAYAGLALGGGVVLLVLSQTVKPSGPVGATATAPATGDEAAPPTDEPAAPEEETAAENMSGLLLLFSMAGFVLFIFFTGWIVLDIHNSRPAWKTQTKYPKRR